MRKPLAKALDIDLRGGLTDKVTPHAGVALLIETGRRSGVIAAAERAAGQGIAQGPAPGREGRGAGAAPRTGR